MQLEYQNKKVKEQCTNLKRAKRDFPEKVAHKLHKLVNFLASSMSLEDVRNFPMYHFHALRGNLDGCYALDIDGRRSSYRLIVSFTEDRMTVLEQSHTITIIQIEEVSNHYE